MTSEPGALADQALPPIDGATPATNWASAPLHPHLAAADQRQVERFHRTLLDEWAHHRPCTSEAERQAAFPDWLDWYKHHRPHSGIGGHTPASRVTNRSGQHTWRVARCRFFEPGGRAGPGRDGSVHASGR